MTTCNRAPPAPGLAPVRPLVRQPASCSSKTEPARLQQLRRSGFLIPLLWINRRWHSKCHSRSRCRSRRQENSGTQSVEFQLKSLQEQLALSHERAFEAERRKQSLVQEVGRERAKCIRATNQLEEEKSVTEAVRKKLDSALELVGTLKQEKDAMQFAASRLEPARNVRESEKQEREHRAALQRLQSWADEVEQKNAAMQQELKRANLSLLDTRQALEASEVNLEAFKAAAAEAQQTADARISDLEIKLAEALATQQQRDAEAAAEIEAKQASLENEEANSKALESKATAAEAESKSLREMIEKEKSRSCELEREVLAKKLALLESSQRLADVKDRLEQAESKSDQQQGQETAIASEEMVANEEQEETRSDVEFASKRHEAIADVGAEEDATDAPEEIASEATAGSAQCEEVAGVSMTVEGGEEPEVSRSEVKAASEQQEEAASQVAITEEPMAEESSEITFAQEEDEEKAAVVNGKSIIAASAEEFQEQGDLAEDDDDEEVLEADHAAEMAMSSDEVAEEEVRLRAIIADMEETLRNDAGYSETDIAEDPDVRIHMEAIDRIKSDKMRNYKQWAREQGLLMPKTRKESKTMLRRRKMLQKQGRLGPCYANSERGKHSKAVKAERKDWIKAKRKQKTAKRRAAQKQHDEALFQASNLSLTSAERAFAAQEQKVES